MCASPHRYGAIILDESSHLPTDTHKNLTVPDDEAGSVVYGVLVNASAVHGAPIFMNLVDTAAFQAVAASKATGKEEKGFPMDNSTGSGSGMLRDSALPR